MNLTDAGRPLTRREIRAREKSLTAGSGDLVPEQAYESVNDTTTDIPEHGQERRPAASPAPAQPAASAQERVESPAPAPEMVAPDLVAPTVGVPMVPPVPPTIQPPAGGTDQAPAIHAGGGVGEADVHADEVVHHAGPAEEDYAEYHRDPHHDHDAHHVRDVHHHHDAHHHDARHVQDVLHHDVHHESYEDHEPHEHEAVGHQLLGSTESVTTVARPSKKVRRRRRLVAILLSLALFVAATVVGAQFLKPLLGTDKPSDYPGPGAGQVKVAVLPGEGPVSVAAKLEDAKVVANADTFVSELAAAGGTLAPGEYDFKQEMKNSDAVAVLLNVGQSKVMYFALSAGLRINESLEAISEGSGIPVAQLKALSDSPKQFGLPAKAKNLEGFLFPGEYRFPVGSKAKDILQSLVKSTQDELKSQGVTDPAKQYDTVTVASIVQAEGGQAEYKDVAGAIYNRLKPTNTETNGLIQSDATVTYGLGKKTFQLDDSEKTDKSNPYNTYANKGLPVGPIGSPGKTAIDAAAKPKTNDYLYWVTINLDTNETKFSKTLAEHSKYVDQYNVWCADHAGRCV